ncbi:MAG: hypothetical protein AB1420_16485 [Bacillota bacterium]
MQAIYSSTEFPPKKALDQILVPDMDKTWIKMEKEIKGYERRQNFQKKLVSIAVLLIVFISGVLVGTSNTSTADFWLFKSVKSWYNDIFNIQCSSTRNPSAISGDIPIDTGMGRKKSLLSLADAANLLDYTIHVPKYLPERFIFAGVFIDNEGYGLYRAELYFLEKETEKYLTLI